MKGWKWPECYNYPPFWTRQINKHELDEQSKLWGNLILAFMKKIDKTELELASALETPLFNNTKLNRKLTKDDAIYFIDQLAKSGNAIWLEESKSRARIYWRTPAQWGEILLKWASDNGQKDTLFTLYELVNSDTYQGEKFFGANIEIIRDACLELQKAGKATVLTADSLDEYGVKFL